MHLYLQVDERMKRSWFTLSSSILVLFAVMGYMTNPVAAVFFGNDTPPYGWSTTDQAGNFASCSKDATTGECWIQVDPLSWPWWYEGGTWSAAVIGAVYTTDQSVTATWYFLSSWDLDYRLNCGWGGSVTISVVYRVYNANQERIADTTAWSKTWVGPAFSWDDWDEEISKDIYKSFTLDLSNGQTYYFAVGLKVCINNDSGAIDVNANSDNSEPALLTVDSITWTLVPPE